MMKARLILVLTLIGVLSAAISIAAAQSGGGYDLMWSTIDDGGGTSSGGSYTLDGTIGQPDAGTMSGGGYTLIGGFWSGSVLRYAFYLPLVLKTG